MGILRVISNSSEPFSGRIEAGQALARELLVGAVREQPLQKAVVLGIPRGGVIIANEIASVLEADLDMVLAHKLGAPGNPELAIGAVCEDGTLFADEKIVSYVGADESYIEQEKTRQLHEIARRVEKYREVLPKLALEGKVVIVTDDGVATGATMQAALWAVRQERPEKIVAALPVGPADTIRKLSEDADETICLRTPPFFSAIGQFYVRFNQVEDDELLEILEQQRQRRENKAER